VVLAPYNVIVSFSIILVSVCFTFKYNVLNFACSLCEALLLFEVFVESELSIYLVCLTDCNNSYALSCCRERIIYLPCVFDRLQ
jgi:hypothetical protein